MSINLVSKKECVGCYACYNSCNRSCIRMEYDEEGFIYPIVDEVKCNDCKKCEISCPVLSPWAGENNLGEPEVYAGWSKNVDIRINSTSGGVFSELALYILKNGGYVCGAQYSNNFEVKHCIINNSDDLYKLRQSKYAQSNISMVYREINKLVQCGKSVLFCGTPCQCEALAHYVGTKKDNLILVDFICRGVNSPKAFRLFLEYLEKTYNKKIGRVWFKNKDYGWNKFSTKVIFTDGDYYIKDRDHDWFMKGYIGHNLYMRPCCGNCVFKKIPRISDITLADFWGVTLCNKAMDIEKGTSMIMVNSIPGKRLFNNIRAGLFIEKKELIDVYAGNPFLLKSPKYNKKCRKYFFDHMEELPFNELIERSYKASIYLNLKRKIILVKKRVKNIFEKLRAV